VASIHDTKRNSLVSLGVDIRLPSERSFDAFFNISAQSGPSYDAGVAEEPVVMAFSC
jgi:hypothetical protein